jgi:hypothetical protein
LDWGKSSQHRAHCSHWRRLDKAQASFLPVTILAIWKRRTAKKTLEVLSMDNYITMQPPLPADTWAAEVTKIQKNYGAVIPDEATKKIVSYLQANYSTEARKH